MPGSGEAGDEGDEGDAGVGGPGTGGIDPAEWLIFRTGPSELGVHPTSGVHRGETWTAPRHHSLALMCDDLDATMAELAANEEVRRSYLSV